MVLRLTIIISFFTLCSCSLTLKRGKQKDHIDFHQLNLNVSKHLDLDSTMYIRGGMKKAFLMYKDGVVFYVANSDLHPNISNIKENYRPNVYDTLFYPRDSLTMALNLIPPIEDVTIYEGYDNEGLYWKHKHISDTRIGMGFSNCNKHQVPESIMLFDSIVKMVENR